MPNIDVDGMLDEYRRASDTDPLVFTIGGVEFKCRPVIPLAAQMAYEAAPGLTEDAVRYVAATKDFLAACVVDEQASAVANAIDLSGLDLKFLIRLVGELGAAYSARPYVTVQRVCWWIAERWADFERAARREGLGDLASLNLRVAVAWAEIDLRVALERIYDDEGAELFMAGDDEELARRENAQRVALVRSLDGEVREVS